MQVVFCPSKQRSSEPFYVLGSLMTGKTLTMDLLEVLLSASDVESGVGLPQKQLQDHIMTFMLAGHEVNTAPSDGLYFLGTVGA